MKLQSIAYKLTFNFLNNEIQMLSAKLSEGS